MGPGGLPGRLVRKGWGVGGGWSWVRGRILAACAVLTALLLAFHSAVPNGVGRLGSLLEAFLPWLGVPVVVLAGLALLRRSAVAAVAVLLPAAVWAYLFGPLLLPASGGGGDGGRPYELVAVQHNVGDENRDPAGTARALTGAGAQLVALEELTPAALPLYASALAADYPHHVVEGSVGLWSKYPLSQARRVDIRPRGIPEGWNRGLRVTAATPGGEIAVYVAHLPSVRLGPGGFGSGFRDESAVLLGAALAAEKRETVVVLGDLNGTAQDRGLAPVTSRAAPPRRGFALSWPAAFPLARIDQVLARSATVLDIRALPPTASDHLPVAARIRLPPP
ncbi:hypothetical protein GCM10010371_52820 [Streptomyces subrutilus]|uniref:Endonuclease/exonuclease/phosphatase domain-containing protein n=1 Tax=Streptomyces subrutilus TaxID=36818 RepID=A0A918R7B9_9ACTN|nr:hypothetical protein GCM10010371_52820 [Streptomyces subrutilus]